MSSHLSERLAIVATIDPQSASAGNYDSDAVDVSKFERVMFVLLAGALGSSGTVDFKLRESDASGGTYGDISGKAATQLTQAGTDDNKQVVIEIKADELTDGKRFVKARVTTATAASLVALVALAGEARDRPISADDLASVDEIVRGG